MSPDRRDGQLSKIHDWTERLAANGHHEEVAEVASDLARALADIATGVQRPGLYASTRLDLIARRADDFFRRSE